jgi:hypothetical protein
MRYTPYKPFTEDAIKHLRKARNISHSRYTKERKTLRPQLLGQILSNLAKEPKNRETAQYVDCVMDEFHMDSEKGVSYFLDTEQLVEILHSTKVCVDIEVMERFPKIFTLYIPQTPTAPPVTLLVSWDSFQGRQKVIEKMSKYSQFNMRYADMDGCADTDSKVLAVWFRKEGKSHCERLGIDIIRGYLSGDMSIDPEWDYMRLAIHTMLYIQACPEAVTDGMPALTCRRLKLKGNRKVVKIGLPKRFEKTARLSPSLHWRTPHLRSYPRRRDGTKREGVVFIGGCWVNPSGNDKTVTDAGDVPKIKVPA